MRVLFIGDSLVKGRVGVNWVRLVADRHKNWAVVNGGVNGETLSQISERLKKKLASGTDPDVIVILAGAQDILLPALRSRGFLFRRFYNNLVRRGGRPALDCTSFQDQLEDLVEYIRENSQAIIVLTTISCLNEDLSSTLNKQRSRYNKIIREISQKMECRLADVAALCDGCLLRLQTCDYFLRGFFNLAWFDKINSVIPGSVDAISRKRKLHLTMDGLHVNSQGARFYFQEVVRHLSSIEDELFETHGSVSIPNLK
jgi:lysophospholipase L1-like esterase